MVLIGPFKQIATLRNLPMKGVLTDEQLEVITNGAVLIEEDEILEKLGIPAREYLLWGQNYDKDVNLLPKTLYKPIKDLTTDHIQAILDGGYTKNPKYIKCFEEELKLRNGNTTNSTETT